MLFTLNVLDVALVLFLAFVLGLLVAAIRNHWAGLRRQPGTCKTEDHVWRGIVAPYAVQCLHCKTIRYSLDPKGNFPDGLREYLANPSGQGVPAETVPPPWRCLDCGESMTVKALCDKCGSGMALGDDPKAGKEIWFCRKCGNRNPANGGLGPIYTCLNCQSWRKV